MQLKNTIQVPDAIIMVKPLHFGYNIQTASSNAFQEDIEASSATEISRRARVEFENFVDLLKHSGITTHVFDEIESGGTPDAVFPNNWISTHPDGTVVLYPMMAPNRRRERRMDIVRYLEENYYVGEVLDLSDYERAGVYLEGTGSIVFDHASGIAYASVSPRTDLKLLNRLCRKLDYQPIHFHAFDESGIDIYHTNVLMNIGDGFAVVCLDCIWEPERKGVEELLRKTGHEIISIDMEQLKSFAGNVLQVGSATNSSFLVMSTQAFGVLEAEQAQAIHRYTAILSADLEVLERTGGGSARCMMAGIHLKKRDLTGY